MATRTWLKLMRNSFGAAVILAAAQVGVGSGLGVLDWPLSFSAIRGWGQLLTWVAFIFAAAALGGAVIGRRALRRPRPVLTVWARIAAAGAAGLGGAAAIALVWIPVRVSQPSVDARAELTMAVTAGVGVLVGTALGVAALSWRPVAAGIGGSVAWVWAFAFASVAIAAKDHVRVSPRLGLIDAPQAASADDWWFSPFLMVGIAAVLGFAVAAAAGWKGTGWLGITLSGLAGPALVASAYLTTGWGISGNGEDAGPYVAALAAVGVGLLASMAVASATIPHRPRPAASPTTLAEQRRALASLPAPLAITSYAEPAYVLESSPVEPAYRREPAFRSETIYLPEPRAHSAQTGSVRPQPAPRPDLNRKAEPAPEATYEPPFEEPYVPPYDPKRPPTPAATPEPSFEVSPSYEPGHAARVEAVVVPPAAIAPGSVVEDAVVVEPEAPGAPAPTAARDATPAAGDATPAAATVAAPKPDQGALKPDQGKRKGRPKDKARRPSQRRGARPENESGAGNRDLRQGERDHIDWIDNLVKLPADPTLKMSKER